MRTQTRFVLTGVQLLIGLLTLPLQPSWAEPIVLDFEDHASMVNLFISIPSEAKLSDDYLDSHGVLFQSENNDFVAVVNLDPAAPSGVNCIGGASATGLMTYYEPIYVSFFDPDNRLEPGITDFVSVQGDLWWDPDIDLWISLEAYDFDGALLATDTTLDDGSSILSIATPGIHSVKFVGATSGLGGVGIDDFTFNPITPIPEPSTLVLLTSAAAGLLCCLIRKRRRAA